MATTFGQGVASSPAVEHLVFSEGRADLRTCQPEENGRSFLWTDKLFPLQIHAIVEEWGLGIHEKLGEWILQTTKHTRNALVFGGGSRVKLYDRETFCRD